VPDYTVQAVTFLDCVNHQSATKWLGSRIFCQVSQFFSKVLL